MRVKICGITRGEDALAAEEAGADAIGLIFAPKSKRRVTIEGARRIGEALGPLVMRVGVFVNAPLPLVLRAIETARLGAVQLHGQESAAYAATLRRRCPVIRAVLVGKELRVEEVEAWRAFPADALLVDGIQPGSGQAFDWQTAAALRGSPRLILAGGLTPDNVAAGVASLRPYGVDVASGVETSPGIKDRAKVEAFVRAAKEASYPQLSTGIHMPVDNSEG